MQLAIADFTPDLPATNGAGGSQNMVNLYPRSPMSWGAVNSLSPFTSNALTGPCLGAYAAVDTGANNYVFAGDTNGLYFINPGSTTLTLLNSQYTVAAGEKWNFAEYGSKVIAAAPGNNLQAFTLGSGATSVTNESLGTGNGSTVTFSGTLAHFPLRPGTFSVTAGSVTGTDKSYGTITGAGISSGTINYKTGAYSVTFSTAPANAVAVTGSYQYGGVFSDLSASAPQARYIAVVKDWVMVANTYDATNGAQPQRVQWCAIDDPTTWPAAGSVTEAQLLAGSQIIPGDQGWIQGIVGNLGTADAAIFFERAIWRVVYQGSPTIFGFYPAEGVKGTPAPKSIVQLGAIAYYLGEDGFYAFDGTTSKPIGVGRVDKTFFSTVNQAYLYNVIGAVDPINKLVFWLYPGTGSSGGTPNSLLIYNWAFDKWGFANVNADYIFRAITQGYSLDSLNSVNTNLDALPYSLDSRVWTGGNIVIGAFDTANKLNYFTGTSLNATAETVEVECYPHAEAGFKNMQGRRAYVYNTRPMIDGGSPSVQVAVRARWQDTPVYVQAEPISVNGDCSVRADGRYVRAQIKTSSPFTHLVGCEIDYRPSGGK